MDLHYVTKRTIPLITILDNRAGEHIALYRVVDPHGLVTYVYPSPGNSQYYLEGL